MAGLTTTIPRLHEALTVARRSDVVHVDDALRRFGVTGIHGEPEVGITAVVEGALRLNGQTSIRVDLDTATDERGVAWALVHGLARVMIGPAAVAEMLRADVASTDVQRAYLGFTEQVGRSVAAFALDEDASAVEISEALDAIAAATEQMVDPPVLWIDHLQAPLVTARHQVDVNDLLWNVRGVHQRLELPIIVSGSRAASEVAHGAHGAFFGDGVWVTLGRPGVDAWQRVARSLGDRAPSPSWVNQFADITAGHPQAMLLALALSVEFPDHASTPLGLWQLMLSLDAGHVARAMQHARTLHRLGGDLLVAIARGGRPYEGAQGKAAQMERQRGVKRLHQAGLITQPRPRAWHVTNPLLAGRLGGQLSLTSRDAGFVEVEAEAP